MSLQHDRIAELCEQLKFARLGTDRPALAQEAAREEARGRASRRRWRQRACAGALA